MDTLAHDVNKQMAISAKMEMARSGSAHMKNAFMTILALLHQKIMIRAHKKPLAMKPKKI